MVIYLIQSLNGTSSAMVPAEDVINNVTETAEREHDFFLKIKKNDIKWEEKKRKGAKRKKVVARKRLKGKLKSLETRYCQKKFKRLRAVEVCQCRHHLNIPTSL